ncbi:MAG: M48 family metallopeptidase [Chlorobiaceae bacterium]|nr:M48 family metallopeptidase [Chlorobiaceae bacterium]
MNCSLFTPAHSVTGSSPLPYSIKISSKAKSARLKMTPHAGLVVVLPEGFNKKDLPALLLRHEAWIHKAADRIEMHRPEPFPVTENGLPYSVVFPYVDEKWSVEYHHKCRSMVESDEGGGKRLLLSAHLTDAALCRRQLLFWLKRKAQIHLLSSFEKLAAAHDFNYNEAQVRLQHSRWGSCTSRSLITLNTKLLFLPEHLTRYIMIHELCHTVHMNHSKAFWALVCRHDPLWHINNMEMRSAWKYVPAWVSAPL